MKYIFTFLFILSALPAFAQTLAESSAQSEPQGEVEQAVGGSSDNASPAPKKVPAPVDSGEQAEATPIKDLSLEDFLKRQEELWLKEKGEAANSASDTAEKLPPPSVLAKPAAIAEPAQPKAAAETETKTAAPAPTQKSAGKKPAPVNKTALSPSAETEIITPEAVDLTKTQNNADIKTEENHNNWAALLKGCVFALVLGVGVWFLSKYQ